MLYINPKGNSNQDSSESGTSNEVLLSPSRNNLDPPARVFEGVRRVR